MDTRTAQRTTTALKTSAAAGGIGLALLLVGAPLVIAPTAAIAASATTVSTPRPVAPTPPDPCRSACQPRI
jgi:hypothetical protein